MKLFFKLIVALFVLFQAQNAHASFSISPMETSVVAPIGGQVVKSITITNGQDVPLYISGSVMDWTLTTSGEYQYGEIGSLGDSCSSWVQLNPTNFVLAPKQTIAVRYSVTTPSDFDREKRAMIFFKSRPLPTTAQEGRMALNISMRMGCKLFITPKGVSNIVAQGKITDMVAPMAGDDKVRVSMANTGLKSMRVNGNIEARDNNGKLVATGRLMPENAQILPTLTRDLWASWEKPLIPGDYTFSASLDYGAKTLVGGQLKGQISPIATDVAPK